MSAAFDAAFGFFVASMLVIAFTAVRWGRRRDRAARADGTPPATDSTGRSRTLDGTGGPPA